MLSPQLREWCPAWSGATLELMKECSTIHRLAAPGPPLTMLIAFGVVVAAGPRENKAATV